MPHQAFSPKRESSSHQSSCHRSSPRQSSPHQSPRAETLFTAMIVLTISIFFFASIGAQAQTFTSLYSFPGGNSGYGPTSPIVTPTGNVIGTAEYGTNCPCFLAFSLSPQGKETVLHRFSVPSGYQAEVPSGYALSKNGQTLYGVSAYGGDYAACGGSLGCGFVFSIDLVTNKYKLLHQFTAAPNDGAYPSGNLALDSAGNLYGMAFSGGKNYTGAIFEITVTGSYKLIYSFAAAPDGNYPTGGLVINSVGDVYGATASGGSGPCNDGDPGCGTIFKVTPSGKETILYNFQGGSDGRYPYWLAKDPQGNLYGVSRDVNNVVIDVFKITPKGQFSIYYAGSYVSQIASVNNGPSGTLVATATGGTANDGEVLQLNSDGTVTVLHSFDGTDGSILNLGLAMRNGAIYGATAIGGTANDGTVFKLVP